MKIECIMEKDGKPMVIKIDSEQCVISIDGEKHPITFFSTESGGW